MMRKIPYRPKGLLLDEDEDAVLIRDDDIRLVVLVHLAGEELGADAAVVVDAVEAGFEDGSAAGTASASVGAASTR